VVTEGRTTGADKALIDANFAESTVAVSNSFVDEVKPKSMLAKNDDQNSIWSP